MAYKKFLFLGTTGVITEQDVSADGIEVNSLKVNSLTAGVAHLDGSGVMSSSEVVTGDIAANAITNEKIAADAVDSLQIKASAVTSAKIATDAVTTEKINGLAVTNAKLAGSIEDSKLASGVASANETGKIVKRDGAGDFAAGTITAALSGNASTASKWFASRSIGFAGGDVTGTVTGLDGSADVSNVSLTIGASKVTNSMLAGSIANDKLLTIDTAGMVEDVALTGNVALLDRNSQTFSGTAPAFSNPLSVGTPTLGAHATTKTYVDDAVAAATSGLDYKQEAQWYWNLADNTSVFSKPNTKDGFLAGINENGITDFTVGDRILLNNESAASADVGIYVFGGASPNYTLTRASDFASGSATGAWIYCLQTPSESGPVAVNTAYVCPTQANVGQAIQFVVYAAGQTYTGTAPIVVTGTAISLSQGDGVATVANKLVVAPSATGAISVSSAGVAVVPDDSTIQISANKVAFKSLPSEFKINGSSTSSSVTAANLGKLVNGASEDATLLHHHEMGLNALERDSGEAAFAQGTPVISNSSGKLIRASSSAGKCLGIVYSDTSGAVLMASSGVIELPSSAIWTQSAPANGEAVYLGDNGKLAKYSDLGSGDYVTKVGRLVSGGKLAISIQDVGLKA